MSRGDQGLSEEPRCSLSPVVLDQHSNGSTARLWDAGDVVETGLSGPPCALRRACSQRQCDMLRCCNCNVYTVEEGVWSGTITDGSGSYHTNAHCEWVILSGSRIEGIACKQRGRRPIAKFCSPRCFASLISMQSMPGNTGAGGVSSGSYTNADDRWSNEDRDTGAIEADAVQWSATTVSFGSHGSFSKKSKFSADADVPADCRTGCSKTIHPTRMFLPKSKQLNTGHGANQCKVPRPEGDGRNDDEDVYYPKGRRPREDEEGEESYEKQRQRPGRGG